MSAIIDCSLWVVIVVTNGFSRISCKEVLCSSIHISYDTCVGVLL